MKPIIMTLVSAVVLICATSARAHAKSAPVKKNVSVTKFSTILSRGNIDIEYAQGNTYSATIVATPEDMKYIKVENVGTTLRVDVENTNRKIGGVQIGHSFSRDTKVIVTSPVIEKVSIAGSADFTATTNIKSQSLTMSVAGSGEIELMDVNCDAAQFTISGSGTCQANKVVTTKANLSVAGSGEIVIKNVTTNVSNISIAGSGEVTCHFDDCKQLDCSMAGSGDMTLSGKVHKYTKRVAGTGSVSDSGLSCNNRTETTKQKTNYGKRFKFKKEVNIVSEP